MVYINHENKHYYMRLNETNIILHHYGISCFGFTRQLLFALRQILVLNGHDFYIGIINNVYKRILVNTAEELQYFM